MANGPYSRNTFEDFAKWRHYVGVRFKQGVPLVDADLNEMDDLRRYELRSFLRWFVGDGVPDGNDGFRILPSAQPNDVLISGGLGTPETAGRCLVDGLEALNETDLLFSAQALVDPVRAAALGVPSITIPTPPGVGQRHDLYYLDVWEREVTSAEAGHGDIVDARIGIETARRVRREWAVRAIDETVGMPANGTPPGHRYLLLARVERTAGVPVIASAAIVDKRRRGVTLQPREALDQIRSDAFGETYATKPLAMPLRDVINAMLRDGPGTVGPLVFETQNGPHSFPVSTSTPDGSQWVFWYAGGHIYSKRKIGSTWTAPQLAFNTPGVIDKMTVTSSPDGAIWLFYNVSGKILLRRSVAGAWEAEQEVSTGAGNLDPAAITSATGDVMVVWQQNNAVRSRRWTSGSVQPIQDAAAAAGNPVPNKLALVRSDGDGFRLYTLESSVANLHTKQWQAGAWAAAYTPAGALPVNILDFTAAHHRVGGLWLIWATGTALLARRTVGGVASDFTWTTGSGIRFPSVMHDENDNLQVFYRAGAQLETLKLIYEI
jgi:hypothetical protein